MMRKDNFYIAPSLLSADFSKLGEEISEAEALGIKYLHIDVMDGIFVPNISFGMPVIKSIRKMTNMIFDVHLMITAPERYIKEFADAGSDIINFHAESTFDISGTIRKIKQCGKKAGLTIKPDTDIRVLEKYLPEIDLALIMSVEPGFGGQKFIDYTLEKANRISDIIEKNNFRCFLEVDGGINESNINDVAKAGCNIAVAGSAFYSSKDKEKFYKTMIHEARR